ncbi:MAG: phosphoglucosamine mutase [Clostridiales bacterium]|jgi:phosphoglucosamine mutase|nr:phosphoglucosamine mutase [Clostridiales bacterium]
MLFGTDGIRGVASYFFKKKLAYYAGKAAAYDGAAKKVVVGRDTRESGQAIEDELIRGLADGGAAVYRLGIAPTMTVAELVRDTGADYGIVISASHNPPEYNGIKIFGATGEKLSEDEENEIESRILDFWNTPQCEISGNTPQDEASGNTPQDGINGNTLVGDDAFIVPYPKKGEISELFDARERYRERIFARFKPDLRGCNIKLDCCFGACSVYAPEIFRAAGANVTALNAKCDGKRINVGCGSTNIGYLKAHMSNSDFIGCAFDGDGDRMLAVTPDGFVADGDSILYVLTLYFRRLGILKHNAVVGTQMSNLGFERALNELGVELIRTNVGDKYVIEKMKECGYVLGGETSGHIILNENGGGGTGDGILAALTYAKALKSMLIYPYEIASLYRAYPQKTLNLRAPVGIKEKVAGDGSLNALRELCEESMGSRGRILIRPSGTEDKLRITAEAETEKAVDDALEILGEEYGKAIEKLRVES